MDKMPGMKRESWKKLVHPQPENDENGWLGSIKFPFEMVPFQGNQARKMRGSFQVVKPEMLMIAFFAM